MIKVFLSLLLSIVSSSSYADDGACPTPQQIASLEKTVRLEEWDKTSQTWKVFTIKDCSKPSVHTSIYQALHLLQQLPPLLPLKGAWASDLLGSSPFSFFTERVKTIRIDTQIDSSQCKPDNENVLAFVHDNRSFTINICILSGMSSILQLASTLVHEARHLMSASEQKLEENKNLGTFHGHIFCKRGLLSNEFACDDAYGDGGSYTAGMEFFLKVARTPAVPAQLREDAHKTGRSYAEMHFNNMPGGTKEGALLLDSANNILFFDRNLKSVDTFATSIEEGSILTLRIVPTVYNASLNSAKSYVGTNKWTDTEGTYAELFRKESLPENNKKLLDVYYGKNYACLLYTQMLYCEEGDLSVTIHLPAHISAVQLAPMNEAINGSDLVHIVSADGSLYMLPLDRPITNWKVENLVETVSFKNFLSVAVYPGLYRMGITKDGSLVTYDQKDQLVKVPELSTRRFKKMIAPYYWTPSLDEI